MDSDLAVLTAVGALSTTGGARVVNRRWPRRGTLSERDGMATRGCRVEWSGRSVQYDNGNSF